MNTYRNRRITPLVWLLATTALAGNGSANATDWIGASGTDWFDPANWSLAAVPTASDNVNLDGLNQRIDIDGGDAEGNIVTVGDTSAFVSLFISHGGTLTSQGLLIGDTGTGSGTVVVTGAGSTLTTSPFGITVGNIGAGTLFITDGGAVSSAGNVALGARATGRGGVLLAGEGSRWDVAGDLYVGLGGEGALALQEAAILDVGGSVFIAADSGSYGRLYIGSDTTMAAGVLNAGAITFGDGEGVLSFNHTEASYDLTADISGAGTIDHRSGVTRLTGDSSGFAGVTNVTGGNLIVDGTLGGVVAVTGTVTINGGTVHVTPENGTDTGTTYTPGTYTIITAAGGVTGTFDTLTDDYAFLDFALSYDADNVLLTSALAATSFCLAGMSANQCATGDATFSLGGGSLYTAVLNLPGTEVSGALDQLSGEIHASAKSALIEDSRFVREAALDRLRVALEGTAAKAGMAEKQVSESFAYWGQGFGSWGHWDSDGNAARLDRDIGGFIMGGDALVADETRFGLLGGYSRSSLSADERSSSGTADTYMLGAYGGGVWNGFSLKAGLAHSWHTLETSRSVAITGLADSLSASYNARTLQAWGEAAYAVELDGARLEPFANLAYVNLHTDGFNESGGAAALTAAESSMEDSFTTLGLRAETQVSLRETHATLRAMAGWRHAFGDAPYSTLAFASGGDAFTIAAVPIASDALVIDAGFDVDIAENATLSLSYNGQFGSGVADQGLKANFAVRF